MNSLARLLLFLAIGCMSARAETLTVYIGTGSPEGIYRASLDLGTGALSGAELVAPVENATFIELSPDGKSLYAVARDKGGGSVLAYEIGAGGDLSLRNRRDCGRGLCHVAVSPGGRSVLVSDYAGGAGFSFPIAGGGTLGERASEVVFTGSGPHPERQRRPHCHSATVSPDGRFVYFADLGTDKLMAFGLDGETAALSAADPPHFALEPGAGPRHMAFSPDGRTAYVINELSNTISVLDHDAASGVLRERQTLSTLPGDIRGPSKCAEVRVHPSGEFVYGSNRGYDSIVVYRVTPEGRLQYVEHETEGISWPRNFNLSPDGKWCVVANAHADNLRVYAVDLESGALSATPHTAGVPKPMCVRFLPL